MQSAPSPATDPRTYSLASYSESPSASPASPHTTTQPFCAMNALMCPTDPRTTMSAPFSEIPQRADASPWITSNPPRAVAAADCEALPSTITLPDIMFSATPTPELPWIRTVACLFMPAQ